jgi:hypothetical protein
LTRRHSPPFPCSPQHLQTPPTQYQARCRPSV